MSTPVPRRFFARPRPSLANPSGLGTASPSLSQSNSLHLSPSASASTSASGGLTPREVLERKASLNQLTSNSLATVPDGTVGYGLGSVADDSPSPSPRVMAMPPTTPGPRASEANGDLDVGDIVDVPGGMYGTVKFIGPVKGKKGVFAGVELSRDFAERGKNDGDVEGISYFKTSQPKSGIFLPVARASKRNSPTLSGDSFPPTPVTPSLGNLSLGSQDHPSTGKYTPPTPSVPKFSQSVGPGRAPSPQFKPKRPSLPRPESPLRKNNMLATPGNRPSLGQTPSNRAALGGRPYAPSPTPGKFAQSLGARRTSAGNGIGGDPGKKITSTPKPGAKALVGTRAASALGRHNSVSSESGDAIGLARTSGSSRHSSSGFTPRARPASGPQDEEIKRLKAQLEDREAQLREQAASLAEMETSFSELQQLLPANEAQRSRRSKGNSEAEGLDVSQLKSLLREKNDKIAQLTAEFDAHRADFRSTIDTLEMASTETERVYEKRVEDLVQQVQDLQGRGEDVDSVARQLKDLEELVQELEEGLEDARRGEADARGEVEFLRGEVERGLSELRREREKAAAALKGAGVAVDGSNPGGGKEVEQRDDEIRGLKAIIHSLSRDSVPEPNGNSSRRTSGNRNGASGKPNGVDRRTSLQLTEERLARETLEREVKELQGLVERKAFREEQLEQELQRFRKGNGSANPRASASTIGSNGASEKMAAPSMQSSARDSRGGASIRRLETMPEGDSDEGEKERSGLWCEICETGGHDILTCKNMFGQHASGNSPSIQGATVTATTPLSQRTGKDVVVEGLKHLSVRPEDTPQPLSPAKRSQGVENQSPSPAPMPKPSPVAVPMPHPMDAGMVAGKASGKVDPDKWCALCERDGHESVDCPYEDAF